MLVYLLAQGRYRLSRTLGSLAGVALGVALFTALVAAGDAFATAGPAQLAGSIAQSLAALDGDQINQAYLRVAEAADVESVIAEAETQVGEVSATTEQSIVSVMGGITEVSDRFASVAALAALLGGLLLTAVTLHAAINIRAREVGVMKATGWRARDVVRLFTIEGIAISALGAAIGVALGWLTVLAFAQVPIDLSAVSSTSPDLAEVAPAAPLTIAATLSWAAVLVATATAVVGGGLVSLLSARRVSRLKPAEALRGS